MQYILIYLIISINGILLKGGIVRLDNSLFTMVKVISINDFSIPDRESSRSTGDSIRLVAVYVCDFTHGKIMETIFSRGELHYDEFILEGYI